MLYPGTTVTVGLEILSYEIYILKNISSKIKSTEEKGRHPLYHNT